jgi:hypothetical protein
MDLTGKMDARERELYEALRRAGDPQAIVALLQREPEMTSDAFLASLDRWIGQAELDGNSDAALGLRQRRSVLVELRQRREREAELPPLSRALLAFIQAQGDLAATAVFECESAWLNTAEAQQGLERSFRSDDPAGQARIAERGKLLAKLRQRM